MHRTYLSLSLLLAPLVTAPASAGCPPVELLYDEYERIAEKRSDTNDDCQHDEIVYCG